MRRGRACMLCAGGAVRVVGAVCGDGVGGCEADRAVVDRAVADSARADRAAARATHDTVTFTNASSRPGELLPIWAVCVMTWEGYSRTRLRACFSTRPGRLRVTA